MKKILGLILELNPFHLGHAYFISEAKKRVQPDLTIAVLSGNFSMRGDMMVIDKWTRSKLALDFGIDLIMEIPYLSSVGSADYFCTNAVQILLDMNITDIAFGVELDNLAKLKEILAIQDNPLYDSYIKNYLDLGHSYSASHYKAMQHFSNDLFLLDNMRLPNNTLALGYLKAIIRQNKKVEVTCIKRIANQYYDEDLVDEKINSATSLRNLLENYQDIRPYTPNIDYPYIDLKKAKANMFFLTQYLFTVKPLSSIAKCLGIKEGIENRIKKIITQVSSYDELIQKVQTRRYPANRIKRLLLNILLDISQESEYTNPYYLRILAMNEKGKLYVNHLPKETKSNIITSFKNQESTLVQIEWQASCLYGLLTDQTDIAFNEFKIPIIKGENA